MSKFKILFLIVFILIIALPITTNAQSLHYVSLGWISNVSGNLTWSFYENDIGIDYLFGKVNNLHVYLGFVQIKRWEKDEAGLDELVDYNGFKFNVGYGVSPLFPYVFILANFSGSICGKDNFLGFYIPVYVQYVLENGLLIRAGIGYSGHFATNSAKAEQYGRYYNAITICLHIGWTFPIQKVRDIVSKD